MSAPRNRPAHDRWYSTARWQRRRKQQLEREPLCRMCKAQGIVTAATVADHFPAHRGEPEAFWNGPLRSLCKRHHDSDAQSAEKGGKPRPVISLAGWPIEGGE
jgi:5-methylcytosine-specific restriction protein A